MCKQKSYGWYDDLVERLIEKDAAFVTEFIDHMPVPSVQVEMLRARLINRLRSMGAMA